ncbi:unnamed protein product [Blepharisma stoltei]|uniref:UDP-glucose:glycoprotein glucosyltransferase n=1 Tax=Blepharisma stoltei TaxID=1481888 RepID=A0AAU9IYT5_9CILI|nr:unnamed protein product [Blepharisma stoltei]
MWIAFLLCIAYAQVEVKLSTQWKGPSEKSLIQEMSEYFAEIGIFWEFLDKILIENELNFEKLAEKVSRSDIEKKVLLSSLYNREFSARMEFYSKLEIHDRKSLTEDCRVFYMINSAPSCKLDQALFSTPPRTQYSFDHTIYENLNSVTAYVDITDPQFQKTHQEIKQFCIDNNSTYILRHIDLRSDSVDYLGGYGAELLVKNMEYKPVEDANKVESHGNENWNLEDLPFKALVKLLSVLPDWDKMAAILETIPLHLADFSAANYTKALKSEIMMSAYTNAQLIGENMLLINNHYLSPDFYTIIGTLRAEIHALEEIKALGIPHKNALKILENSNLKLHQYKGQGGLIKTGPQTGRVYINDLENDKKYSSWTKNYQAFLMSYGNELEEVARNFFNIIAVLDIRTEAAWNSVQFALKMYLENWPVRIGFILIGNDPVVNVITQGLKQLKNKETEIFEFLMSMNKDTTIDDAINAFNAYCTDCEFDEELSHTVTRANNFCEESGICGPATWILNGRVLDVSINPEEEEESENKILLELLKEKRQIAMLIMYGMIDPPLESFFENVKHGKPVERLNLEITHKTSTEIDLIKHIEKGFIVELNDLPKVATITVIAEDTDKDLVMHTLEIFKRFSHLGLRIRYIFKSSEISQEWYKILCFLKNLKEKKRIGNVDFGEFQCEYKEDEIKKDFGGYKGNLKSVVIVNGRIIQKKFIKSFRDIMIAHETESSRVGVDEILEGISSIVPPSEQSNIIENISLILLNHVKFLPYFAQYSSHPIPQNMRKPSITKFVASDSEINFRVDMLLNPLSEKGQILASLGKWLLSLGSSVNATLNPDLDPKKKILPINRFHKINIKSNFDDFMKLGETSGKTFTLGLDVPESWVVRTTSSDDLDNLMLNEPISVSYELKNLLATGQCTEYVQGYETEPPSGLQLALINSTHMISDTIVMKNLGYYQFKANPGIYNISLFPGRSEELFTIMNSPEIIAKDLSGTTQRLSVSKRPGYENEVLLNSESIEDLGDVIHIFSLASGKLYERLMKIMMLSVMRNTNSKVKFWLFEDFFTQNFKNSLEAFSKKVGFQYEFVSYKWPSWLFAQREKQRIIWAYKILFLDVMFPLNVKKIIYIDADQVVRADIKELWDMDLEGAPYGYTPFCDSNPDTEGFRFWKQGYWRDHLKDLPYHISALYVIDLFKFRSMGAGDILRYFYETMAPNPDSLSNLDQDLPNFAQYQVPIKSLPSEWLWCATWCSEETKSKAKTIDLCNNPLTKEPKIHAAKRIISEWEEYDNFIRNFENPEKPPEVEEIPKKIDL